MIYLFALTVICSVIYYHRQNVKINRLFELHRELKKDLDKKNYSENLAENFRPCTQEEAQKKVLSWLPVYNYISLNPNCNYSELLRSMRHHYSSPDELKSILNDLLNVHYKIVLDSEGRFNTVK